VLRDKNRELSRRLHDLFGNAQENERLAVRTHQLTLALMKQANAADTLRAMAASLAEDFQGDLVRIVSFRPVAGIDDADWLQVIAARTIRACAGFRDCCAAAASRSAAACIRTSTRCCTAARRGGAELRAAAAAGVGLVAVGSRDPNRFFPGMGTLFLRMMGEALAAGCSASRMT
jgi:uncharacterized protein YigA (DUF484 family)